MGGRKTGIVSVLALLALPVSASAHGLPAPLSATTPGPTSCPGAAIQPDRVIEGSFDDDLQGSSVLLPVNVPAGTTGLRVKYCYDQPEAPTNARIRNTLDLGLYEPRADPAQPWGVAEFRGWGGSSHPDVTVSPQGFSSQAEYEAAPRAHVYGKTTRAFTPGPVPEGQWAVELGVAAVTSQLEGDADGKVAWRVEVDFIDDPALLENPYAPAAYDETPAQAGPGWYAGDMHVHAEHSALGDATMREVFDYSFDPFDPSPTGGAGLDFITLSDYVSGSAWGEIGRYQADYPGKLIIRSAEVITYRGHTNNHASADVVDYRTGDLYVREASGELVKLREARPASEILDAVHGGGGFTQINHPTIFPSLAFSSFCRGCPWDYSASETGYDKVDGIEIATGPAGLKQSPKPGPNPFTATAIQFWEDALSAGHKIAAIGVSDSHNAGRTKDPVTQAPIGQATTVVYAPELSEAGIEEGVQAGHTYVKVFGNDGPGLRFEARLPGSDDVVGIMGDTVRASQADLTARVMGAAPSTEGPKPGAYQLLVVRNGVPILAVPVTSDDFNFSFPALVPGRYRLQLQRGTTIEAVSSPIYLEAPPAGPAKGGKGKGPKRNGPPAHAGGPER